MLEGGIRRRARKDQVLMGLCGWHMACPSRVVRPRGAPDEGDAMLWTVIVLLLLLWVIGFMFAVAGGFIHLLLLVVAALFLFNLIRRRRAV